MEKLIERIAGVPTGAKLGAAAAVAILVTVVALAACWSPAWRATRVVPTEALRTSER